MRRICVSYSGIGYSLFAQLTLKCSQLGIFEFKQTLQGFHLRLHFVQASIRFSFFTTNRVQLLFGHIQLVAQLHSRIGIRRLRATLAFSITAGNQTQSVFRLGCLRRRRCYVLLAGVQLALGGCGLTRGLPGRILGGNLIDGITLPALGRIGSAGHFQRLVGTHAIDVAINKSTGIEVLDCQHGLMN